MLVLSAATFSPPACMDKLKAFLKNLTNTCDRSEPEHSAPVMSVLRYHCVTTPVGGIYKSSRIISVFSNISHLLRLLPHLESQCAGQPLGDWVSPVQKHSNTQRWHHLGVKRDHTHGIPYNVEMIHVWHNTHIIQCHIKDYDTNPQDTMAIIHTVVYHVISEWDIQVLHTHSIFHVIAEYDTLRVRPWCH